MKRPDYSRQVDLIERAWAAGLFEGEGCFTRTSRPSVHLRADLQMTDGDVVRTFARIVGVGRVAGPVASSDGNKPVYRWRAVGDDVRYVFYLLSPWLHSRRRATYELHLAHRLEYEERLPAIVSERTRRANQTRAEKRRENQEALCRD